MLRAIAFFAVSGAIAGGTAVMAIEGYRPAQARVESPATAQSDQIDGQRCTGLTGLAVETGRVDGAERFAAGDTVVGGTAIGSKATADFCRVRLTLNPAKGSEIKVEVWLPSTWNEKLMGFGGGGFDGSLNRDSGAILGKAIGQGYAAVATDVGHTPAPTPGTWIHAQPEKVIDFGYRGTHLAAAVAKQVIRAYYGKAQKRAYFQGCSNGGRDALSLVSRYPDDYDAVVAGAPAIRYVEVVTQLAWYSRAAATAPGLKSKLGLVHDAIIKKCDALDGVKDGVLGNPRLCRFDPAELECKGQNGAACLTGAEVSALKKIYGGPRLRNGAAIFNGPSLGSEGDPDNWTAWITGPVPGIASEEFYRWMVYDDASWKLANFDLDRDYGVARSRLAPIINADSPDIRAFVRRGGKLIIYQGWDDPAITPESTIAYYERVRRIVGPKTDRQVRLFMVPGMMHCGGGAGATQFDMQSEMERWDRDGVAPTVVRASKSDLPKGSVPLTRPLCAWPRSAHYKGSGSNREAANYECRLK